jgi:hypothetical protein
MKSITAPLFGITGLLFAMIACVALASPARAQTWVSQQSGVPEVASGKTKNISGAISGSAGSPGAGACSGGNQGFANQCIGGHTCTCTQISGANFSGNLIGKGSANIFITVDASAGFGLPTPTQQPMPECFPFVSEIDLIAKNDTQVLDATGAICSAKRDSQLGGAFAIGASNFFTVGFANFTASLNGNNGSFKMSFKGEAVTK